MTSKNRAMGLRCGARVHIIRPAQHSRKMDNSDNVYDKTGVVTREGNAANGGWFEVRLDNSKEKVAYYRRGSLQVIKEDGHPHGRRRSVANGSSRAPNTTATIARVANVATGIPVHISTNNITTYPLSPPSQVQTPNSFISPSTTPTSTGLYTINSLDSNTALTFASGRRASTGSIYVIDQNSVRPAFAHSLPTQPSLTPVASYPSLTTLPDNSMLGIPQLPNVFTGTTIPQLRNDQYVQWNPHTHHPQQAMTINSFVSPTSISYLQTNGQISHNPVTQPSSMPSLSSSSSISNIHMIQTSAPSIPQQHVAMNTMILSPQNTLASQASLSSNEMNLASQQLGTQIIHSSQTNGTTPSMLTSSNSHVVTPFTESYVFANNSSGTLTMTLNPSSMMNASMTSNISNPSQNHQNFASMMQPLAPSYQLHTTSGLLSTSSSIPVIGYQTAPSNIPSTAPPTPSSNNTFISNQPVPLAHSSASSSISEASSNNHSGNHLTPLTCASGLPAPRPIKVLDTSASYAFTQGTLTTIPSTNANGSLASPKSQSPFSFPSPSNRLSGSTFAPGTNTAFSRRKSSLSHVLSTIPDQQLQLLNLRNPGRCVSTPGNANSTSIPYYHENGLVNPLNSPTRSPSPSISRSSASVSIQIAYPSSPSSKLAAPQHRAYPLSPSSKIPVSQCRPHHRPSRNRVEYSRSAKRYHVDEDEIDAETNPVEDDVANGDGEVDDEDESDYDMDYESESELSDDRPSRSSRRKLPKSASYSLSRTTFAYDAESIEAAETSALASLAALSSALPSATSLSTKTSAIS